VISPLPPSNPPLFSGVGSPADVAFFLAIFSFVSRLLELFDQPFACCCGLLVFMWWNRCPLRSFLGLVRTLRRACDSYPRGPCQRFFLPAPRFSLTRVHGNDTESCVVALPREGDRDPSPFHGRIVVPRAFFLIGGPICPFLVLAVSSRKISQLDS